MMWLIKRLNSQLVFKNNSWSIEFSTWHDTVLRVWYWEFGTESLEPRVGIQTFFNVSADTEVWCRSSGMDPSFTWQAELSFWDLWLLLWHWANFWPLRKSKKRHGHTSRTLIQGKAFWVAYPKRRDQKFCKDAFWISYKKIASHSQDLWLLGLASGKSPVDPATQVRPIPKTMFFWAHVSLLQQINQSTTGSVW